MVLAALIESERQVDCNCSEADEDESVSATIIAVAPRSSLSLNGDFPRSDNLYSDFPGRSTVVKARRVSFCRYTPGVGQPLGGDAVGEGNADVLAGDCGIEVTLRRRPSYVPHIAQPRRVDRAGEGRPLAVCLTGGVLDGVVGAESQCSSDGANEKHQKNAEAECELDHGRAFQCPRFFPIARP